MKQIVQSYKTGEVVLREVPAPVCGSKGILVRTGNSLISIGTERSTIELGRKSLIGKATARPDLVRRAWDKAKKEGLLKTWQEAMGRLDTPTPLGYSCSGRVVECGVSAGEFSPGDRVACIGQGFASHAEFVSIPVNLACHIPDNVSDEEAAFGMLGIIALHGIRSADLTFGSRVVVMGLGLLGLLTVQILRAYGCEVIAMDPDKDKVDLAEKFGATCSTTDPLVLLQQVEAVTYGAGVDSVIITAATKDRGPVDQAIHLCRVKGKIVIVGTADIHPDRNELWLKEVELIVSKAAGPGSLDPVYEIEGVDFPIGEVRWTQKRNLQEFLRLLSEKKLDIQSLISHRFSIDESEGVYSKFISNEIKNPIGVLLEYSSDAPIERLLPIFTSSNKNRNELQVGVIGAGLFGKALLLPALKKQAGITLRTLVTGSGANVEHSGRKFGFELQSTDAESIWMDPLIDAVIGLTPHSNHASLVLKAIEHKKPLFLEKPLCISPQELEKIIQSATDFDLPLVMVGHNRRFSSHTKKMREWLSHRKSPMVLNMRINAGFISIDHWVHSESEGRSRIVGEMSHFIDLFQDLSGSQVNRVSAERVSGDNRCTVNNDNIVVNFKFDDGSIGSLTYSASGDKSYSREAIEIFFDGNTIFSQDFRMSKFYMSGKVDIFKTRNQEMGYVEELGHFLECVAGKKGAIVQPQEMFQIMRVVFAIEDSLGTAQSITL